MKKIKYLFLAMVAMMSFASCVSDNEELQDEDFDYTLIVGRWVDNDDAAEHWRYDRMDASGRGTGVYWNSDDMTEADAAEGPGKFEYSFSETGMMRIFWQEMTGAYSNPDTEAPFIIDDLTTTTLKMHSSSVGRHYSYRRL